MALMELNTKQKADAGVPVDILHPSTGLPIGVRITVLGSDSAVYQELVNRQTNKRLQGVKRAGKIALTAEQIEKEALDILVGCTTLWESYDPNDPKATPVATIERSAGEFLECIPENVRVIYADEGFSWLRKQVDTAIGDQTNFLRS